MEDHEIVALYWARDEEAITQSGVKYGAYCRHIAQGILERCEDVEEALSDTWLSAWNAMPPARPAVLRTFLGRLCRNLCINRSIHDAAQKRGGKKVVLALEELHECIPGGEDPAQAAETSELSRIIDAFLRTLPRRDCDLFLRRYWYLDSIETIAAAMGLRPGAVKTRLYRIRGKLRTVLEKEGYAL